MQDSGLEGSIALVAVQANNSTAQLPHLVLCIIWSLCCAMLLLCHQTYGMQDGSLAGHIGLVLLTGQNQYGNSSCSLASIVQNAQVCIP